MIGLGRRVQVFAFAEPVDMRKSFDTLGAIVREQIARDVLEGALFVFVGKDRRRAKVLFWDGPGMCVLAKRLEKGRFSAPSAHKTLLWGVHAGRAMTALPVGATTLPVDPDRPEAFDLALGFRRLGPRLVRVDRIERLSAACRLLGAQGPFKATPALAEVAGCAEGEIASVLKALGYRAQVQGDGVTFLPRRRRDGRRRRAREASSPAVPAASGKPFARLGELVVRRQPH